MMKLSSETLSVLQNFAKINKNLKFKEGNTLSTISVSKTILAKATISDQFPEDFCVYDLNEFLLVYNLNKDTEVEFDSTNIIFKSGRSKMKYRKTEPRLIVTPEKSVVLPSVDAQFTLTEEDYANVMKTASVLRSPNISFESDGSKILVTAFDQSNDSAHIQTTEIGDGNGTSFKAIFDTENLKMIPGTYEVVVSFKGFAHFKNTKDDIQYWVAFEAKESKVSE